MNPQDQLGHQPTPSGAPTPASTTPQQSQPKQQGISDVLHPTINVSDALKSSDDVQEEKISTIRTFQSDLAGAVKQDNISMIKIAMAEKTRQEQEGDYADVGTKRMKPKNAYIIAFGTLALVFVSVGFVYYFFNRPAAPTLEQIIAPNEPEIIYSESQVAVSIDGKSPAVFLQELQDETLAKIDLGTIKRILVTTGSGTSTQNINAQQFLDQIRSRAPDSLKRALSPFFVIGAYSFTPHDVFIIFKVDSYDNAYAGMLAWEPYIKFDIGKMFPDTGSVPNNKNQASPEIIQPVIENPPEPESEAQTETGSSSNEGEETEINESESAGQATTTTDLPAAPTTPAVPAKTTSDDIALFTDKVMQNKDTRVLYNPDGTIKLLYSFLDKKTLVIVSSEKGLKEIITRTTTGRIVR